MATITKTYSLKVETQSKEVDQLNTKLQKTESDLTAVEAQADKMSGGLITGFKAGLKGVKSMIGGIKTLSQFQKCKLLIF